MTNYPQRPNVDSHRGMGDGPLADPGMRLILSMSPQDGSVKPLPSDLAIQELANGSMRISYPDGSIRELIPGAEGEGRMITTLADGTRIQSDLTMGEGQVSIASISSTGEKTFLSLNENGANMQKISADGDVTNVVPESAPELIEGFRAAEAFSQAEQLRQQEQEQFNNNQDYGDWNNFGKPMDWQPEQNWQPPQYLHSDFSQTFPQQPAFTPQQEFMPPHQTGEFFAKPDYAGANWVDNGNGSWIAPIQPDSFSQPNWQPHQNFDGGFNQSMFNQPPAFMPPQQFDGGFNQPPAFMPPPQFMPPQQFDGGFNQPPAFMPPQQFMPVPPSHFGGQFVDSNGFPPSPPMDASGFPLAPVGENGNVPGSMLNHISGFEAPSADAIINQLDDSGPDPESLNQVAPQF